eukprot:2670697-Pleurochrysis_carterae.AAC.3
MSRKKKLEMRANSESTRCMRAESRVTENQVRLRETQLTIPQIQMRTLEIVPTVWRRALSRVR